MPKSYQQYVREEFQLSPAELPMWSPKTFVDTQITQNLSAYASFQWGQQIPRRLGGDATADELAADKKRLKKIAYMLTVTINNLSRVGGVPRPSLPALEDVTAEQKSVGAQVDVDKWLERRLEEATSNRSFIATVGDQANMGSWVNRMVNVYNEEIRNLERLMGTAG